MDRIGAMAAGTGMPAPRGQMPVDARDTVVRAVRDAHQMAEARWASRLCGEPWLLAELWRVVISFLLPAERCAAECLPPPGKGVLEVTSPDTNLFHTRLLVSSLSTISVRFRYPHPLSETERLTFWLAPPRFEGSVGFGQIALVLGNLTVSTDQEHNTLVSVYSRHAGSEPVFSLEHRHTYGHLLSSLRSIVIETACGQSWATFRFETPHETRDRSASSACKSNSPSTRAQDARVCMGPWRANWIPDIMLELAKGTTLCGRHFDLSQWSVGLTAESAP
jgi:hypothetical protein